MLERFSQSFRKNPWAWILGGLLAFSVYSNHLIGSKFTEAVRPSAGPALRRSVLGRRRYDPNLRR